MPRAHDFGVQGFRVEDLGLRGWMVAGFRVWRFSVAISEFRDFRVQRVGFSDWR